MKLKKQEIESILKLKPFQRYKYFLKKVSDWEVLYGVYDENIDDWFFANIDNHLVFSIWPAKEYASMLISGNWKNAIPRQISLDSFLGKYIPLLEKQDILLDIFPVENKSGFVVNCNEFKKDIEQYLIEYD